MAPRAYWKGHLRLSLVSIPVEMYNAVETKNEISFRQIHKPSGRRINYTKTVQGVGEIKSADIVKGYEVGPDEYVTLDPEEIDALQAGIEEDDRSDAFRRRRGHRPALLRTAVLPRHRRQARRRRLRRHPRSPAQNRQGRSRPGDGGRSRMARGGDAGRADGLGMVMLRYADELRDLADFFEDVPTEKPDKEMVDLAVELIERKAGIFKPDEFENHYHTALKELVDEKLKGHKIRAPEEKRCAGRQGHRPYGRPQGKHRQGASEGEGQNRLAGQPAPGFRQQEALGPLH